MPGKVGHGHDIRLAEAVFRKRISAGFHFLNNTTAEMNSAIDSLQEERMKNFVGLNRTNDYLLTII